MIDEKLGGGLLIMRDFMWNKNSFIVKNLHTKKLNTSKQDVHIYGI